MAQLRQSTRDAVRDGAIRSAEVIWPLLIETLGEPVSVLDVGAGEGHWGRVGSHVIHEALLRDVDLPEWDAETLAPLPTVFETDLRRERAGARWALALCLEMAEHVSPAAGEHLVRELTRVSEVVVWSAAIPGQGGDGHVNEQPPGYWGERFARFGWVLTDPFREALWDDPRVEPWYAQNLLLATPQQPGDSARRPPRYLIHPTVWRHHRGLA